MVRKSASKDPQRGRGELKICIFGGDETPGKSARVGREGLQGSQALPRACLVAGQPSSCPARQQPRGRSRAAAPQLPDLLASRAEERRLMDPGTNTMGSGESEKEATALDASTVDNLEFTLVMEDGQEKFACHLCEYKTDKAGSVKRHLSAKHGNARGSGQGRKRKSMESKKVESKAKEVKLEETLSESVMENLEEEFTSTQVVLEREEKIMEELEGGMNFGDDDEDDEEESDENSAAEWEEKYEEEKKKNAVLQGKVNALEEIKERQKKNMDRMIKIGTDYKAELDKVKATKGSSENAKLKKELKEAKASINELQKKVEKLTTEKAKAEAEATRLLKHNDHLEEALERTKKPDPMQKASKDCPFWMEGQCNFSEAECYKGKHRKDKFNTKQKRGAGNEETSKDCPFWLEGLCNFSEAECYKGKHREERFNTKQRRGAVNEEKIVNNVLEALSKQQRSQLMPQQQLLPSQQQPVLQQQMFPQMLPPQQPTTMAMQPQFHQQMGFRTEPMGRQWTQQDLLDRSMAGTNGSASFRFPQ